MSNNYYFDSLKQSLEAEEQTPESILSLIQNTDFFFKVLKVKFESEDPEMMKQGAEEIKEMLALLEAHQKQK